MSTATTVACKVCGAATTEGVTTEVVPDVFRSRPAFTVEVGVCPDCQTLRPDEPGSAVRAALRLVGKPEEDWPLAAQAFEEAGVDVTAVLYGPRSEPQRKPWAHVPREAKADLRRAYVRVLDHRVHASARHDRPVPPHAPPAGHPQACLMCGVGRSAQWHGPTTTGAYTKPGVVTGYLCDGCIPHLEAAGAHGAQALERAVLAHRGRAYGENMTLPGLTAWATEGLPPQAEPWAWVPEIRDPAPPPTLADALQAIAALTAEVEALKARLP